MITEKTLNLRLPCYFAKRYFCGTCKLCGIALPFYGRIFYELKFYNIISDLVNFNIISYNHNTLDFLIDLLFYIVVKINNAERDFTCAHFQLLSCLCLSFNHEH